MLFRSAAVEFIHTATLLHDDVVDSSDLRRGRRTANLIWGNPASVLVGDFLFSRAFELMVEDGSLKVLRILSHASAVIAEGEVNQLTDDVIDYASDAATMGKGVGDDFRDGKMTLPVILAYARGSEADRRFWQSAIGGDRVSDADLAHAIQLMRSTDALSDTIGHARRYGRRAMDALAGFPANKAKAALVEAVEFAIARAY